MAINIFVVIRILIGSFFVVSGFEKLIGPYQNFLYVVQSYDFLNAFLENGVAHVLPWIELFLGVFLVLGFWQKWVTRALMCLLVMFILVVIQALIRGLPITECGCFGGLISFPLPYVIVIDSALLLITGVLAQNEKRAGGFSLDHYFAGQGGV